MREHVKATAEAKFGKPWKHHGTSAKQHNRLSRTQQLWYAGHEEYLPEWDQDEDLGQGFWEWYDEREEEELAQQDWEDLVGRRSAGKTEETEMVKLFCRLKLQLKLLSSPLPSSASS